MRKMQNPQITIGEVDISKVKLNLRSRDDIPRLLLGIQVIYMDLEVRAELFKLLEEHFEPFGMNKNKGRPGMNVWNIFVCAVLKLNLNLDYDRLAELASNHVNIQAFLGHSIYDNNVIYNHQTLKDNIDLFTPELLDKINNLLVKFGHKLIGKKKKTNRCMGGATLS